MKILAIITFLTPAGIEDSDEGLVSLEHTTADIIREWSAKTGNTIESIKRLLLIGVGFCDDNQDLFPKVISVWDGNKIRASLSALKD